jgi:hypothetical protein
VTGHGGTDRERRPGPRLRSQRGRQQHRGVLGHDGWVDAGGRQTDARCTTEPSRSGTDGGILPPAALLPLRVTTAARGCPRAAVVRVRNDRGSRAAFIALPMRGDLPPLISTRSPRSCETDARPNTSASSRKWVLCLPMPGPNIVVGIPTARGCPRGIDNPSADQRVGARLVAVASQPPARRRESGTAGHFRDTSKRIILHVVRFAEA